MRRKQAHSAQVPTGMSTRDTGSVDYPDLVIEQGILALPSGGANMRCAARVSIAPVRPETTNPSIQPSRNRTILGFVVPLDLRYTAQLLRHPDVVSSGPEGGIDDDAEGKCDPALCRCSAITVLVVGVWASEVRSTRGAYYQRVLR